MSDLREQIVALADCGFKEPHEAHEYVIAYRDQPSDRYCPGFTWDAVLDIIDKHECYQQGIMDASEAAADEWAEHVCIPDTSDLARALLKIFPALNDMPIQWAEEIIAALKEQE